MDQQNSLNPITPEQPAAPTVPPQDFAQQAPQPPVVPTVPQEPIAQPAAPQPEQSSYYQTQPQTYQPEQTQYPPYPQGYQPNTYIPQGQQYNSYAPMQYQMMPIEQEPPKNGLSVAALVTGILGVTSCTPFPCSILALIFGIIGYRANKQGTALAGIVLGAIGTAILIFLIFIFVLVALDEAYLNDYSEFARILSSFLQ